ncbi:esterase-like activity of phytase family protein [Undibacterium fentianense]|uniref:Esterase-like activity of phytase family protein n=1 Tax=Undibacterium fentianense TaxID=2828728 RepID=A0A941IFJ2_9BURK|nr:esterase-like activity of phytase family protein [Undibacterium fentianense]MBR7800776.1 esterase-like activity of phytase family protein [Undibacterium fentianense]
MKQYKRILKASVCSAALILTACGGSDRVEQKNVPTPVSGVFLDAAVEGLDYSSATTAKQVTAANGGFACYSNELVSFSLGGIQFGNATCATLITPFNLAGTEVSKDDKVVNRLIALQTFDSDYDPSNGIQLNSALKTALAGQSLDFSASAANFNLAMNSLLAKLPAPYSTRSVDADRRTLAKEHFEDTLASKAGISVSELFTQNNALGAVTVSVTRYQIQAADQFYVPYEGLSTAIKTDFPKGFLPSYGSGLSFKGKAADGSLEFYGLTDRGPNGDGPKVPNGMMTAGATGTSDGKFFPAPSFTPSFGVISVGKNGAILKSSTPIKFSATQLASGLSIAPGKIGSSGEVPLTDAAKFEANSKTIFSDYGIDTEAVVWDATRNVLWVSDEYGPFILKIDPATGIIQKKYQPGTGAADLPAVLLKRRANRGMEGLSIELASGKLHGFIQSPLDDGKAQYVVPGATVATSESIKDYAKFNRWVEFDPSTEKTRLFAYPIDAAMYSGGKTGGAKLGDVVSLGNDKFIVIEQGAGVDGKVFNRLMLVQIPADVTDIAMVGTDLEKSSMTGSAVNAANYATIVPLKKTVLFDLNSAGWLAEKAEGLALVDENTLALVNDDDFGLKTIVQTNTGAVVDGADITKCTVDLNGAITATSGTGCAAGNTARVARGADTERPNRLWLIKFAKKLNDFLVP